MFLRAKQSNLIIACALVAFLLLGVTASTLHAQEKKKGDKELVFGFAPNPLVTATSFMGGGTAQMREIFENLAEDLKKNFGYEVTPKIYPAPKFLHKAFQDKTLDFAVTPLPLYLLLKAAGASLHPLLTVTTTGKKNEKLCLYVNRVSNIKNVKQLKGKMFATDFPVFNSKKDALPPKESYIYWVIVKKILAANGINQPFIKFFKGVGVLPAPSESVQYAVLLNKFHASYSDEVNMLMLRNYDKGFKDLVPLSCIEAPSPGVIAYRADLNPQIVQQVKTYALFPPKHSEAHKLMQKYKGMKIVSVSGEDYGVYFTWLKEAEQKGWLKEFNEIMKNIPKPKSKEK